LVKKHKKVDADEFSQALIELNSRAQHYQQVYIMREGEVSKTIRCKLKQVAEQLKQLLQGL
jgi:hypothetical protein